MPEIKEVKKDLEKFKDIIILGDSEGGKILIKRMKDDVKSAIGELNKYQTCSHQELMAIACKITERLSILRTFTNAKTEAEALESILEEEAPE